MPHDPKLGENFRVRVRFADTAGVALAVSGVTVNARRPDGTTVDGTVIPDAEYPVGGFIAIFEADMAGDWWSKPTARRRT